MIALAAIALAALAVCAATLASAKAERDQHARDRAATLATIDMLCQRIQAPDTAIAQHVASTDAPMPQPPAMDDDQAYWEQKKAEA